MSDDVFRIIVAVAVILACISFLVQGFVMLALYRVARKMQEKVSPLIEKGETVAAKAAPIIEKAGPLVDQARSVIEKAGPVIERVPPALEKATAILATTHQIIEDNRPRISEIMVEGVAIAKSGREHVERIGSLVHEAGDRARTRLEQIDRTVDHTVEQVDQISNSVKNAAMRPVREVNGIAAGFSAVMSTLLRGSRRSSVDHATQDEEMFI
jgi:low affinity Fe/Cu permease